MLIPKTLFAAAIVLSVSPSPVGAHSFQPNELVQELYPMTHSAQDLTPTTAGGMNAVVNAYQLWQAGGTLQVCFMAATQSVRQFFVDTEREWEKYANIHWDFGSSPSFRNCDGRRPSHIRISFENTGDWSLVGTASIQKNVLNQASLNIGQASAGDTALVNRQQLRGTILHEVGHALGLEHEHQSPNDPCISQIKWTIVYAELGEPPNNWDKAKVDQNLGSLTKLGRLRLTAYDPGSIMHYAFPAEWFSNPACAVGPNYELSQTDQEEIGKAYPKNAQDQRTLYWGPQC